MSIKKYNIFYNLKGGAKSSDPDEINQDELYQYEIDKLLAELSKINHGTVSFMPDEQREKLRNSGKVITARTLMPRKAPKPKEDTVEEINLGKENDMVLEDIDPNELKELDNYKSTREPKDRINLKTLISKRYDMAQNDINEIVEQIIKDQTNDSLNFEILDDDLFIALVESYDTIITLSKRLESYK